MSSASTSDNVVPQGARSPQHCRTVSISSGHCKDVGHSTADDSSLHVPNKFLFTWYRDKTQICHYLSLINAAIVGHIVQLNTGNDALAMKVHRRAGSVYGTAKKKHGCARMEFLGKKICHFCFSSGFHPSSSAPARS